jgi:hypothetical protein
MQKLKRRVPYHATVAEDHHKEILFKIIKNRIVLDQFQKTWKNVL